MTDADRAKLSERKTVHEWLNTADIPREENGKPICLLRRLRIACDRLEAITLDEDDIEAVAALIRMRKRLRDGAPPGMKYTGTKDGHRCFIEDK